MVYNDQEMMLDVNLPKIRDCFGVHLWCKTELFHDCCKEEEELCLGKILPQALSLTCRVEFKTRGSYLFEKMIETCLWEIILKDEFKQ